MLYYSTFLSTFFIFTGYLQKGNWANENQKEAQEACKFFALFSRAADTKVAIYVCVCVCVNVSVKSEWQNVSAFVASEGTDRGGIPRSIRFHKFVARFFGAQLTNCMI